MSSGVTDKDHEDLFFALPEDMEMLRRLLREPQGYTRGILYLITFYLAHSGNPVRLSANFIRKRFFPLQINAERSTRAVHPCIRDFLDFTGLAYERAGEFANPSYPVQEGLNTVFLVSPACGSGAFLFPRNLLEDGFERICRLHPLKRQGRSLLVAKEKLYLMVWMWRLWTKRNAAGSPGIIFLDILLKDVKQEIARIRSRDDIKPRELISSLACMDRMVKIRELNGTRAVVELLA